MGPRSRPIAQRRRCLRAALKQSRNQGNHRRAGPTAHGGRTPGRPGSKPAAGPPPPPAPPHRGDMRANPCVGTMAKAWGRAMTTPVLNPVTGKPVTITLPKGDHAEAVDVVGLAFRIDE